MVNGPTDNKRTVSLSEESTGIPSFQTMADVASLTWVVPERQDAQVALRLPHHPVVGPPTAAERRITTRTSLLTVTFHDTFPPRPRHRNSQQHDWAHASLATQI